ncbi:GxxExxY protein [uncultured Parabacteroides sp.]|uniref:GxxExxY protein n=1 Tax=uncultured Parabacteroides sp. TaxID=512312 RepID=UPI0026367696|nr:GxxExxY protein [uncultured Parabacteroides sp.]
MKLLCKEITDQVLSAFYAVYNELGFGFLESVYQNALYKELCSMGLKCEPLKIIEVYYKGEVVGKYIADMVVEDEVILELKASSVLTEAHEMQLQNYLKATRIEVGLLLNFGAHPEFRRKVFANNLHDRYKQRNQIK